MRNLEPIQRGLRPWKAALQKIGEIGGPRCCKRNSYLAILSAIDYAEAVTGVRMSKEQIVCRHTHANNQ